MDEFISALKRASPKVTAIIVIGWIATKLLDKEELSTGDILVFSLTLLCVCIIYFISADIIKKKPRK